MVKGITLILSVLNIIGLDPYKQNKYSKLRRFIAVLVPLYMNFKNILGLILSKKGLQGINDFYTLPSMLIMLVKCVVLSTSIGNLKSLLEYSKLFWPDNKFGPTIEQEMKSLRGKIDSRIRIIIISVSVTAIQTTLIPVMFGQNHGRPMLFTGVQECDIKNENCYQILITLQCIISILMGIPLFMGFDLLFFYFLTQIYCSFHLLKLGLLTIDLRCQNYENERNISLKIGDSIDQHIKILKYIKKLKDFFAGTLLFQAVAVLLCIAFILIGISSIGFRPSFIIIAQSMSIGIAATALFLFYCLGGSIIMDQSLGIGTVVYEMEWWRKLPHGVRNKLSLIILRSQKPEQFTMGNFADLNLASFVEVLRAAISIYTLMLNVQQSDT